MDECLCVFGLDLLLLLEIWVGKVGWYLLGGESKCLVLVCVILLLFLLLCVDELFEGLDVEF